MIIREAKHGDEQGVSDICGTSWRDTYKAQATSARIEQVIAEFYQLERLKGEIGGGNLQSRWFVAEENQQLIGCILGGGQRQPKCEIYTLYLDLAHKRRGIGTLLVNELSAGLKENGFQEQWVSVDEKNESGITFYESLGFRFIKKVPQYFDVATAQTKNNRMMRRL